ncbi:MAG: acyl transferase [Saprospiraceae bacterium]|nr:acyl transferase [Saprospiraceae bacterium]
MSFELKRQALLKRIYQLSNSSFEQLAMDVYAFQAEHCAAYRDFHRYLGINPAGISNLYEIPFLPIQAFKSHTVQTGHWESQRRFESSGTTGQTSSKHYIRSLSHYLINTIRGFESFYGELAQWNILALLPSYLERGNSSLVCMVEEFIEQSESPLSGFFLHDHENLLKHLEACKDSGKPTLLMGVTYALLDFAESHYVPEVPGLVVMETGGMKGRRREITRKEVHQKLKEVFKVDKIHSEYGMTEMLSQAYSKGKGIFYPTKTMAVLTADVYDPLEIHFSGRRGVLQVVDLANLDTCSFIATEDLGFVFENGAFEVIGRLDASEMRGCNLMVEG